MISFSKTKTNSIKLQTTNYRFGRGEGGGGGWRWRKGRTHSPIGNNNGLRVVDGVGDGTGRCP